MNELNFKNLTNNLKQFGAGFLLVAFCLQMFSFTATAQFVKDRSVEKKADETLSDDAIDGRFTNQTAPRKIAPDLEEETDSVFHNLRGDKTQKVIIQLKTETPLNKTFKSSLGESDQNQMFAQEAGRNKIKAEVLMTDLAQVGGRVKKSFNNLGLVSAELPVSKIRELSENETVAYVSPDREVESFGYVERVIGANQSDGRSEIAGFDSLNGTGVGIAVLD